MGPQHMAQNADCRNFKGITPWQLPMSTYCTGFSSGPIAGVHLKVNEGQKFSRYPEDRRSKSKGCIKYNKFLWSDEGQASLDLTQTVVGLCCKLQPCRYFICFYLGCYHLSGAGSGRTRSVGSSLIFLGRGGRRDHLLALLSKANLSITIFPALLLDGFKKSIARKKKKIYTYTIQHASTTQLP